MNTVVNNLPKPSCIMSIRFRPAKKLAHGFSMLEVLISIIVLSFGLLGMVGMQATALQSNKEARLQSSGVRMARELSELMRGNKNIGTKTASSDNPYLIDYSSAADTIAAAPTNCLTGDCYSNAVPADAQLDLAKFEVQEWLTRLNNELPGVRVKVCFDTTPFDANGIPQWACTAGGTVAVIKVGWTRGTTDRTKTGAAAFETVAGNSGAPPSVVLPVTAGSTT
jgi:type IV pilus assembly protein PilV